MSNLGIYRLEFEKAIVIFEIIILELFHGDNFMQVLCSRIFGLEFEKISHILNQHPQICLIAKLCAKKDP